MAAPDRLQHPNRLQTNKICCEIDNRCNFSSILSDFSASNRLIIVSNTIEVRRRRLRTLIVSILIMLAAASLSAAQSDEGKSETLLAKADNRALPAETALSIERGLALEKNPDLSYNSPSLKAEDLPLVISSADSKTISVVLPPFLYFKTQF